MSLIVCSNNEEDVNNPYDRTSLDQAPYRFRNHLIDPLELPVNSEVAVQSVKCNKDGLIKVSPYDQWFQYFNVNVRTSATQTNTNLTTASPILCSPIDLTKIKGSYMNMDEFKDGMTDGMRLGFPHPDSDQTESGTHCAVSRVVKSGANANEFEGFKMTYKYYGQEGTAHTSPGNQPTDWNYLSDGFFKAPNVVADRTMEIAFDDPANVTTTSIKALVDGTPGGGNQNCVWANQYPLSHMDGHLDFDLTKLKEGATDKLNGGWALGLTRGIRGKMGQIQYLDPEANTVSANPHFFDVVVYGEQINNKGDFYMRVGHSAYSIEQAGLIDEANPIGMKEVVYYDDGSGSSFSTKTKWLAGDLVTAGTNGYNLSTNTCKWDNLRFRLLNEKIHIEIMATAGGPNNAPGTYYTICDFAQVASQDALNSNIVKPMGMTCWNLYPKVLITKKDRSVKIFNYSGMKTTWKGEGVFMDDIRRDWFCRMGREGTLRYAMDIDCRKIFHFSDALPIYPQLGLSGAGVDMTFNSYENIAILGDATPDYLGTQQANLQARLGWNSRSVLDSSAGTVTNNKVVYYSDNVPDLLDYSSMFVRLDNFTQKSYNSGTGRPSKILYQVPRFDTSNRETGNALYYEPHQRTYIKLNNSAPIKLNELQLSLCDNDERLCSEGVVGRTVICLHFQESQSALMKTRFGM